MISEIFITTISGEPVIWKRYRRDVPENTPVLFASKARETKESTMPPYMKVDDVWFYHIKRQGLHLVATTKTEMLPVYVIELLTRVNSVCKDFCGVVNEESLSANIVLIYEILDEIMDFGYVQLASTEKLKPYIQSEPVPVKTEHSPEQVTPNLFGIDQRTVPSNAADKPVIRSRWDKEIRKNEIFVDVIERMTVLIAANGSALRSEVSGQVNVKSFLMGTPHIKIGLNEDLTVGRDDKHKGYGSLVHLDECTFHSCVDLEEFQESRLLTIRPPEGEFAVMSYNLHGDMPHGLPFRLLSHVSDPSQSRDVEVSLKLRCEIPSTTHAVNVVLTLPVPQHVTGVSQQLSGPGQSAEFVSAEKKVTWNIRKIYGKSEVSAYFKLILPSDVRINRQEIGPVAVDFEISGYVTSNLQIRFLRVFDRERSYVPQRWVRYITVTDSYIVKLA